MRKADRKCYELCTYQANVFSESINRFECSSKIFIRRFFYDEFTLFLDFCEFHTFSYDEEDSFKSIIENFGDSTYGKEKLPEPVLHYLGYISRYICYTREITSLYFYHTFSVQFIIDHYETLHTQSEEYALSELLRFANLTEDIFDQKKVLKEILRKHYKY